MCLSGTIHSTNIFLFSVASGNNGDCLIITAGVINIADSLKRTYVILHEYRVYQSGRSPKVLALFSATNFSSYIIKLPQLHDKIQI